MDGQSAIMPFDGPFRQVAGNAATARERELHFSSRRLVQMSTTRHFLFPLTGSAALHAGAIAALVALAARGVLMPRPAPLRIAPSEAAPASTVTRIVFLPAPGLGGGGGGGGNGRPEPIRHAEGIGHDAITLRIAKPVTIAPLTTIVDAAPALPALVLEALPLASGTHDLVGLPVGGVPDSLSTGPGSGGGVGTGTGTGIGPGVGPGLGPGRGGGAGGGVYRPGGSVTPPRLVSEVRPTYTADALARRAQGSVVLEAIVMADGVPAQIRILRSLDPDLDERAIAAVTQWRFEPGRLAGRPVNVLVTVVLDFTIH
jgi:TonB family protein